MQVLSAARAPYRAVTVTVTVTAQRVRCDAMRCGPRQLPAPGTTRRGRLVGEGGCVGSGREESWQTSRTLVDWQDWIQ